MSQVIFDTIDPTISGTELAQKLNDFKDALMSGLSGTSRPTELEIGGSWVDTTNDPTSWSFRIWSGTDDIEVFKINLTTGIASVALAVDSFIVKKISADTVGAVMEFVKRRIANNGQVLDGDVVGEIRMVGRTDSAGNPVVAKIVFTATDDQTTSAYGGTLDFYSTPDGTAALTNHMRFINGLLETIVPHKLNSQILVSQNIATAATIAQLSAAKILVEMTGATATNIQGLNSAHDSKVVTIHNRSSAAVTLKHEDTGAIAADRMKLPTNEDFAITPEGTATLYYCTTDTRWKLLSTSSKISGFNKETLYGKVITWTAPANISAVKLSAFTRSDGLEQGRAGMKDTFGNLYFWGLNTNGQIGDASIAAKSSPVAVAGGLTFIKSRSAKGAGSNSYGLAANGAAYAWGVNTNGQIGDITVAAKSSPVAVAGGLRYTELFPVDATCFGLSTNGLLMAWGINTNGQLGVGNVVPRSSPVAVLGGIRFADVALSSAANVQSQVLAIDRAGAAYAWGLNTNGNLGLGDVVPRSSPVAVLGGLTFSQIYSVGLSTRYSSYGLDNSGNAYSWGANTHGNLGHGDVVPKSSPVAVVGGITFQRLVINKYSETIFGLTSAGVLYAWGDNTQGVLGVGDTDSRSSPVAVLGGLAFTKVALSRNTAFGMTADGTLYGWGANTNGILGVADVVSRSSPVAVLGGLKFSDVAFPDSFTDITSVYGLTTTGVLYAWGGNANGTLGLGDVTPRSSPVAVLGVFGPKINDDARIVDLSVTPSASYVISVGPGMSFFGSTPIGKDIYKVELEYPQ